MSELLSSITGGGGGLPRLAPDLTNPGDKVADAGYKRITLDPSTGLITALNLTGKYVINLLRFNNITTEAVTIKLTIDGVIVWNDTNSLPAGNKLSLLGASNGAAEVTESIQCDTSLLLEIQTATDTQVEFEYVARPIL